MVSGKQVHGRLNLQLGVIARIEEFRALGCQQVSSTRNHPYLDNDGVDVRQSSTQQGGANSEGALHSDAGGRSPKDTVRNDQEKRKKFKRVFGTEKAQNGPRTTGIGKVQSAHSPTTGSLPYKRCKIAFAGAESPSVGLTSQQLPSCYALPSSDSLTRCMERVNGQRRRGLGQDKDRSRGVWRILNFQSKRVFLALAFSEALEDW